MAIKRKKHSWVQVSTIQHFQGKLILPRDHEKCLPKEPWVEAVCASQHVLECGEFEGHSFPESSDSPYLCCSTSTVEERALRKRISRCHFSFNGQSYLQTKRGRIGGKGWEGASQKVEYKHEAINLLHMVFLSLLAAICGRLKHIYVW